MELGNKDNIIRYLTDNCGYTKIEAEITFKDLMDMDEDSKEQLVKLINDEDIREYAYKEMSVGDLCEKYKLTEVAALLSVSMLKKDYTGFKKILGKGNK